MDIAECINSMKEVGFSEKEIADTLGIETEEARAIRAKWKQERRAELTQQVLELKRQGYFPLPPVRQKMQVGELVREIRAQKGWTQAEAGALIGVGRSQICNVETGRYDLPASKLLKLLEEAGWAIVAY